MAILKTNQIDKALTKKGFEARPKDHNFYYYINDGKKLIYLQKPVIVKMR